MRNKWKRKRLLSILVAAVMIIGLFPNTAFADTEKTAANESDLTQAISEASDQTTIKLTDSFTLNDTITIADGKNIILDLNGKQISTPKQITVNGKLTIKDSGTNGKIDGSVGSMIVLNSTGTLNLQSGVIQTTKYGAIKTGKGSTFNMSGGSVIGDGAIYASNGTINITAGKVGLTDDSTKKSINNTSATITIGTSGGTSKEDPWIDGLAIGANKTASLYSGYITSTSGTFAVGTIFNCVFGSDISNSLPAGKMCVKENDKFTVQDLTEESDAAAKIGDTLYSSTTVAAKALTEGQTLVLLQDVTANTKYSALKVTVPNATIDLNGHNITNEAGEGISVEIGSKDSKPGMTASIINTASEPSTITAAVPLNLSGKEKLDVKLEGNLVLNSTTNQQIQLKNEAQLLYSDDAVAAIGNGGFKTTTTDGEYIYGSLSSAIAASVDGSVELVNDYTGTDDIRIGDNKTAILDLQGHTFECTNSNSALSVVYIISTNSNLTIKNGSLISLSNGVSILQNNSSVTLDNVKVTANGTFGAVTNGTQVGNNLTLKNNSFISAPNGIGVYWPSGNGVLTIDNSQITGHTGVQVCGGSLDIKGANTSITATGTPQEKTENDGPIMDGAAVSIIERDGYKDLGKITVQDGSFSSADSSETVKAYSFNNIDREEGKFDNSASIVTISGGNYSSSVDKDLLDKSITTELYSAQESKVPYSYFTSSEEAQNAAKPGDIIVDLTDENIDPSVDIEITVNDGTGNINKITINKGATITVPSAPDRDGYRFLGWSDGTNTYNPGDKITVTTGMTLTAQWEEIPYTGKYSYEVFTSVGDNGSLTVDRYATEGDKVTIEVTPDEAYLLDELVVTANGKEVELTDNGDGTYTFTIPSADVRISATFAEDPDWTEPEEPATDVSDIFIDVAPNAWYKDAVQYAYDNGLMTGVSANEFAPDATTTRGMIVSMLARLEGVESANDAGFADVEGEWYATAVNWAASVGVVNGYEDNTFRPNDAISREQLAAILMNYAAYKGEDVSARASLDAYSDAENVSTWATDTMSWAVAEGYITGMTADTLQPQGSATRAQVAAILERYLAE